MHLTAASPEIWEGWVQHAGPGWPVLITGRWRAAQVTRKTGFALLAREEQGRAEAAVCKWQLQSCEGVETTGAFQASQGHMADFNVYAVGSPVNQKPVKDDPRRCSREIPI